MSFALVGAQVLLIAMLAWPSSWPVPGTGILIRALMVLAALALALWALVAMRLYTFGGMPETVACEQLGQRGPYARIRHPVYNAVLIGDAGA